MSLTTPSWIHLLSPLSWPQHPLPPQVLLDSSTDNNFISLPLSPGLASSQPKTFSERTGIKTSFPSDRCQECPLRGPHQVYKLPPSRKRGSDHILTSCSMLCLLSSPWSSTPEPSPTSARALWHQGSRWKPLQI